MANITYEDLFWTERDVVEESLPWVNAPKINAEIEVEGAGSWGGLSWQAETRILQFNAADYNAWDTIAFEWFGFRPRKVMIQGSVWVGLWYFNAQWNKRDQTTNRQSESWDLMYLDGGAGSSALFRASLLDFTDDGFRVTVDSKTNDFFFCYATCFTNI